MKNLRVLGIAAVTAAVLPFAWASTPSDDGGPRTTPAAYVPPVLRELRDRDTAIVTLPVPTAIVETPPPVLRRAKPALPAEFVQDSIAFLESHLNQWEASDAAALLGDAQRQRPSYDDDGKPNGVIFAYADPLNRYKGYELDFEGATGKLRTIFFYPPKMTWRECRRVYGTNVSTTAAGNGRTFHSYFSRRLDVLVDASGNVISLGIY